MKSRRGQRLQRLTLALGLPAASTLIGVATFWINLDEMTSGTGATDAVTCGAVFALGVAAAAGLTLVSFRRLNRPEGRPALGDSRRFAQPPDGA